MPETAQRRMTHEHRGELVVFLIGMRVNRPWRPDLWLPVFAAMPKMLRELAADPGSGYLGSEFTIGANGPLLVQYWNSVDKLYAYANNPAAAHRPAWAAFNRLARRAPGAVGVWHETYVVDRAETLYSGMPTLGLAKATVAVPVARRGEIAAQRLAVGRSSG